MVMPMLAGFLPVQVFAHEAYVLSKAQFENGLHTSGPNVFNALRSSSNLRVFFLISIVIFAVLVVNFLFSRTRIAKEISNKLEKLSRFGPLLVRLAISASFFFSALSNSFLGPEIPLDTMPYGLMLRAGLFLISFLILLGFFTELAGLVALISFTIAATVYHWYLASYLNYFGEIIVLILFGTREQWSVDRWMFGKLRRFFTIKLYEIDIVRAFYGLALMFVAVDVKLLHPNLTMLVVNQYHLTQFHWLFPHDPLLVTLGAALAELTIGLFILLGFQLRLTVLITLFYITLSLFFFREMVWPHFLLYGISFNLLITPQKLSLDNWLAKKFKTISI